MAQRPQGLRGFLRKLRTRFFAVPADMYLRIDRIEQLVAALKSMQEDICGQRISACQQTIENQSILLKSIQDTCVTLSETLEIIKISNDTRENLTNKTPEPNQRPLPHFEILASDASVDVRRRSIELLRLLKPFTATGFRKARFGSPNDGGYILIDDFEGIDAAISCGIEHNASWDVDIADRGVPVYQFDHTVDTGPVLRTDLIFTKARIVAKNAPGGLTMNEIASRYAGKAATLILKIDIEHDEWDVFDAASESALASFRQIVGEFHGFDFIADQNWSERARRVFKKITKLFGVVHIHANNYCGICKISDISLPALLEITFVNKSIYELQPAEETFPGPLDTPNDPTRPDIPLGRFMY